MKPFFLLLTSLLLWHSSHAQTISTVAGGGMADPGDGGQATDCKLNSPAGVAVDAAGNIYVCQRDKHKVRKISPGGIISTYAGTGTAGYSGNGGPAINAELNRPYAIAIKGSDVYIGDQYTVRKINEAGIIITIAGKGVLGFSGDDGPATNAELNGTNGIAIDNAGNLYISEYENNRIRKVNTAGIITTVAGTGALVYNGDNIQATNANLYSPSGVAVDNSGNIYITDSRNNRIRMVNSSGVITTYAGTGTQGYGGDAGFRTDAQFDRPIGIYRDQNGNIFISDTYNGRIRRISPIGIVSTLAGDGGSVYNGDGTPATAYRIFNPVGVTVQSDGSVLVGDFGNNRLRKISDIVAVPGIKMAATLDTLTVYPNPSTGKFSVNNYGGMPIRYLSVSDMAGRVVKEINNLNENLISIDITGVSPGLYIVTAHTASGNVCGKVTII